MPEPQRSDTLTPLNLATEIERRRPGFVRNKKKFTPHVEISSKALEHYQNFNQMNMKKINFYEYLPQRFAATSEQIVKVRNLIYNFKSGRKEAANFAADLIVRLLWNWYGHKCNEYTIVCVPASSNAEYRHRFSYFSHVVACRCQQDNAMKHIQILGKREALHRTANHVVQDNANYHVVFDKEFFAGRKVIIFDDLVTTGATAENFAALLQEAGAEVIGALFIAKSVKGISKKSYNQYK